MKIINLIEDTKGNNNCSCEHGLSFYIETEHHKILCDTGATDAFIHNAKMLGVDLTQVDTVFISHGHYDHAGGLLAFTRLNNYAKIYMQKSASGAYYHLKSEEEKYIGIDKQIMELPQLVLLDGEYRIDDELFIFSNITGKRFRAKSNQSLKQKLDGNFIQDEFAHEQCLVIKEQGKTVLLSGCAHNGILNVLEAYQKHFTKKPDIVISGFHMVQKAAYTAEDIDVIEKTAMELRNGYTTYYTGHCTGGTAYEIMKVIMEERLQEIHSGEEIEVNS